MIFGRALMNWLLHQQHLQLFEDRENPSSAEKKEVDAFLMLPLLAKDECPYKWWTANKMAYPNIHKVAKKFLSAPCSSVYSKCIFSEAGNIIEDSRNRLNPQNRKVFCFYTIIYQDLTLVTNE